MIDLSYIRDTILRECRGLCEGNLVIVCREDISIHLNINGMWYTDELSRDDFKGYVYRGVYQTDRLLECKPNRIIMYSFRSGDKLVSVLTSFKTSLPLFREGYLAKTIYSAVADGLYISVKTSYINEIKLDYPVESIVRSIKPILISGYRSGGFSGIIDLKYIDSYSIIDSIFKKFFNEDTLLGYFINLNKFQLHPRNMIRFGYYMDGGRFVEFPSNYLSSNYIYLIREFIKPSLVISNTDIDFFNPPYVKLDLSTGEKILYVGGLLD